MSSKLATTPQHTSNLIENFAQSQLQSVNQQYIKDSTFLILATSAFFYGADQQLRKQSGAPSYISKVILSDILAAVCGISERNVTGIIKSINRLSKQFYLIESIVEQGEQAAEQWLNCEEAADHTLNQLIHKYKNLSMFDLGIEGINQQHATQQKKLYQSIEQTVTQLRYRAVIMLVIILSIFLVAAITLIYLR